MGLRQRAPVATVVEVADLVEWFGHGWDRHSVLRWVKRHQVPFHQAVPGGKVTVAVSALKDAFPDVWDSILDREALLDAAA